MKTYAIPIVVAAFLFCAGTAVADETATCKDALTPDEASFVQSVKTDLTTRFSHAADAERAGYVRYTNPDDTGAISYANDQWNADPAHPSQLWYDSTGLLLGADFSVPRPNGEPRPKLWGIRPCRWFEFNGHIHYVIKNPSTGAATYDRWVWNNDWTAAGGDLAHPSAQTLVKLGRVPNASYVPTIFDMPTQWDLIVWLRPHPAGQLYW